MWYILLVFKNFHSPLLIMDHIFSLKSIQVGLSSVTCFGQMEREWTQHTLHPHRGAVTTILWLPSSLVSSLCNENGNVLDQEGSFILNPERVELIAWHCLSAYSCISCFLYSCNISKKINSCS